MCHVRGTLQVPATQATVTSSCPPGSADSRGLRPLPPTPKKEHRILKLEACERGKLEPCNMGFGTLEIQLLGPMMLPNLNFVGLRPGAPTQWVLYDGDVGNCGVGRCEIQREV